MHSLQCRGGQRAAAEEMEELALQPALDAGRLHHAFEVGDTDATLPTQLFEAPADHARRGETAAGGTVEGIAELALARPSQQLDDGAGARGRGQPIDRGAVECPDARGGGDHADGAARTPRPRHEELQRALLEAVEPVQRRRGPARHERVRPEVEQSGQQPAAVVERHAGEVQRVRSVRHEQAVLDAPVERGWRQPRRQRLEPGEQLALVRRKVGEGSFGGVHAVIVTKGCAPVPHEGGRGS